MGQRSVSTAATDPKEAQLQIPENTYFAHVRRRHDYCFCKPRIGTATLDKSKPRATGRRKANGTPRVGRAAEGGSMDKMTLRRIGWVGASLGLTTALVGCSDV